MAAHTPLSARWIDVGILDPAALHAAYMGAAHAQRIGDAPLLLWGKSRVPHIALGASQNASEELDLAACQRTGVNWLRRPLGGGTVLVDADQHSFFFVLPPAFDPARQALAAGDLFPFLAPAIVAAYQALGLPVESFGAHDFWLHGRKIGGTGAGLVGRCQVFAGSFLHRFDRALFSRLVAAPSDGFRRWLADALAENLVTLEEAGVAIEAAALAGIFRDRLEARLNWRFHDDPLHAGERAALRQALASLAEDTEDDCVYSGTRRIPYGIKVKGDVFLSERTWENEWIRVLTQAGRISRIAGSLPLGPRWPELIGLRPREAALMQVLRAALPDELARLWAARIAATAYVLEESREEL